MAAITSDCAQCSRITNCFWPQSPRGFAAAQGGLDRKLRALSLKDLIARDTPGCATHEQKIQRVKTKIDGKVATIDQNMEHTCIILSMLSK